MERLQKKSRSCQQYDGQVDLNYGQRAAEAIAAMGGKVLSLDGRTQIETTRLKLRDEAENNGRHSGGAGSHHENPTIDSKDEGRSS